MFGAIAGDVIGSVYEMTSFKKVDFPLFDPMTRFTDDTVMTMAVAYSILQGTSYTKEIHKFGNNYPNRGYGGRFRKWLKTEDKQPYNSWGNGGAMRVSPVGFAFNTLDEVLKEAEQSANPTHNHPEGVKGAQAVAATIFLARTGKSKKEIKEYIETSIGYDLNKTIDEIRPTYKMNVSTQGSVPEAIIAFLDSNDIEHAIRLAVSLGGDADTQACIAGGIAQAYYKEIPMEIYEKTQAYLPPNFITILKNFEKKYNIQYKLI